MKIEEPSLNSKQTMKHLFRATRLDWVLTCCPVPSCGQPDRFSKRCVPGQGSIDDTFDLTNALNLRRKKEERFP